jgi:hypothetical protein
VNDPANQQHFLKIMAELTERPEAAFADWRKGLELTTTLTSETQVLGVISPHSACDSASSSQPVYCSLVR